MYPMSRPRSTLQASFAHNYCVELSNARINQFGDGFFPSTTHLWNSPSFCISGFLQKAGLSPPQGPDGIFFYYLFRYFINFCFFTAFSISYGMQTRERAHCALSVLPFIKKKKKNILPTLSYGKPISSNTSWNSPLHLE